ncbi:MULTISPECIES: DUF4124 domain-containing protein [unclassified Pseudomonas]|uniref:DUF4124 domain-containing protein n=1 Tax=unclassified Pseudomonas TaxID=196821 RepID=UPI0025EB82A8|nr:MULTISPECIES: DUF4124 domain-containing protein [unclassified Pseudomonas]
MRQSLALVLLLLALPAVAQIYKYTDANGNTAFSSQPPDGKKVETVDLPPLNSLGGTAPMPSSPSPSQNQIQAPPTPASYQTLQLTDLPNDEALRANNGSFIVGVMIQPRLQPGHLLQLLVDGKPYGQPTNVPRVQVTELDRGEHSLSVQVLQGAQVIQQSQTINLTVQRVHVGRP